MTQTPPYQVTDPATGEVAETFPFATDAEVAEALAAATEAFAAWRMRPVGELAACRWYLQFGAGARFSASGDHSVNVRHLQSARIVDDEH